MTRFEWLATDAEFDESRAAESTRSGLRATKDILDGPSPASALFTGPAGSGKTLAARSLAASLERPLARIGLSALVSRFIGETEKNVTRFLDAAAARNAIVLFDQADEVMGGDAQTAHTVMALANDYPGHVIFESRESAGVPRSIADRVAGTIEFLGPRLDLEELEAAMRAIAPAPTGVTAFVGSATAGPVDDPVVVTSLADVIATFGTVQLAHPMSHALAQYFDAGGRTAVVVRVVSRGDDPEAPVVEADFAAPELESDDLGLWALRDATFDVLVVPPAGPAGEASPETRRAAADLCAERRAFHITDPPSSWTDAAVIDVADLGLVDHQEDVAVYWPRIEASDGAQGTTQFPPSAAVAGVYARTDADAGVWKAPAGPAALVPVTGLALEPAEGDPDRLTPLGVNVLRSVPAGIAVWGARTLAGGSEHEWRYVPVRRLGLQIERSLLGGLDWVVFEPNDEPLWGQIRLCVATFLSDMFRRGAFEGATAEEAWFVRCGRETTTQADIESGLINVVVGFAPLKPAEFVTVDITLRTAGAD